MNLIKVQLEVTRERMSTSFTLEDLDRSEEEWSTIDDEGKRNIVQKYIDDNIEQPSWILVSEF